jgi:hypothetical protein
MSDDEISVLKEKNQKLVGMYKEWLTRVREYEQQSYSYNKENWNRVLDMLLALLSSRPDLCLELSPIINEVHFRGGHILHEKNWNKKVEENALKLGEQHE